MTDEIIDLTRYLRTDDGPTLPRGAMALWGVEGENSRFALPLWRAIYLSGGDLGLIVSRCVRGDEEPGTFVALDLAEEPARTAVPDDLPPYRPDLEATLVEMEGRGVVVHLGAREGRVWSLVVLGAERRDGPLQARAREDILFLAGECAGLLFARALSEPKAVGSETDTE